MKHLQLIAIIFFVSMASFAVGYTVKVQTKTVVVETAPVFGGLQEDLDAEKAKSHALRKKVFLADSRLKGDLGIDLSFGTPEQWVQSGIDVAEDLEIELNGNENLNQLSGLIRAELGQQSMLCNNPNSQAYDPKDNNTANP